MYMHWTNFQCKSHLIARDVFLLHLQLFSYVTHLLMITSIYWLYTLQKQYIFIHQALLDLIDRKKKGLIQDDRDDRSYIDKEIVYENTAFGMCTLEICSVYICSRKINLNTF